MKAYLEPGEIDRLEQAALFLRDKLLVRLLWRLGFRSGTLGKGSYRELAKVLERLHLGSNSNESRK